MNAKKMNGALDFLRGKYGAAKGEITIKGGHCFVGTTPLLPGRMERKIVELKKMTENGTLEGVSTLRFAAFALLQGRASAKVWKAAWAKATKAAKLAFAADKSKAAKTIAVKKGLDTNRSIAVAEVR